MSKTGGIYVPPFRKDAQTDFDGSTDQLRQLEYWEDLKKSINGLINKVNVTNILDIIHDLFRVNLIKGRGLFTRSLLHAQMASPTFTPIFACLVAVINSRIPELLSLIHI